VNHRRAWAIARKEFLHVVRDRRSLAMAIAMPMFLLLLYGYALTLDGGQRPMIVWDQSQTTASRDFISRLEVPATSQSRDTGGTMVNWSTRSIPVTRWSPWWCRGILPTRSGPGGRLPCS